MKEPKHPLTNASLLLTVQLNFHFVENINTNNNSRKRIRFMCNISLFFIKKTTTHKTWCRTQGGVPVAFFLSVFVCSPPPPPPRTVKIASRLHRLLSCSFYQAVIRQSSSSAELYLQPGLNMLVILCRVLCVLSAAWLIPGPSAAHVCL